METTRFSLLPVTVHETLYASFKKEMERNGDAAIPQPSVVIGESGAGKTTLLKRLYSEAKCSGHPAVWIDGRTLFSTGDIVSRLNGHPHAVLFIDDMDFYFSRCGYDEQYRLRKLLYNEGAPMLIGSVRRVLPAFSEYEAPFFEGLNLVYMPPLALSDDIKTLFAGTEAQERASALYRWVAPTIKSLETIYGIISNNKNPDNDLALLINAFSDGYRAVYEDLPVYSQHILNVLGGAENGLVMAQLRQATGLTVSILPAYLKNLRNKGLITVDASKKKFTRYAVKNPLFRLWLSTEGTAGFGNDAYGVGRIDSFLRR